MTISRALAVDPGNMTGWAYAPLDGPWNPDNVTSGQAPADAFCDWAAEFIEHPWPVIVFVESFTVTAQTARLSPQPVPIECIGVLKFLARRAGAQLELQTPAAAKRFVSDAQLRKLGLWQPGKDHARDALRHLVLGIVTHVTGQAREELIQSLA